MANFSDLPTEIQLLICRDLSRSELFKLKSLNSLFFNLWMDIKWKLVMVGSRNPVRLLQRVVDPFVAMRPKTLTINLHQNAVLTISKHPKQTFDDAMTVLFDSLPLLPNITSLTIEVSESSTFDVAAFFLRMASLSFPRELQSLSPFESLTRLDLYLMDNPVTQTKFSLSLEHFLRSLMPTLQSLYISTKIDLSPVFNALAQPITLSQSHSSVPFPNLTLLFLVHFNISFRCDPRSLCYFLLTHNNLQHFSLRVFDTEAETLLGALLTELVNHNDQLPFFRTLELYPSATQAGLSALLALIKRSAPTLSSLMIPIRFLTDEEAKRVVDALAGGEVQVPGMTTATTPEEPSRLKSLKMNITHLSVPFLDLLARKLPQLEALHLSITNITGSDQHSFDHQLFRRWYDPNLTCSRDVLHAWKLEDLSIDWKGNSIDSKRAERVVSGAVPALARKMDMDM